MNLPGFLPEYTGPFISDGKLQSSVPFGATRPKNKIEYESRLHDTSYATYDDYAHRTAADEIYKKHVGGVIGNGVFYGNALVRGALNLSTDFPGLAIGGAVNLYNLADYTMNHTKYLKEVTDLYDKDPFNYQDPEPKRGILHNAPGKNVSFEPTPFTPVEDGRKVGSNIFDTSIWQDQNQNQVNSPSPKLEDPFPWLIRPRNNRKRKRKIMAYHLRY
jgi:hypothetical protein